jgi:flagellin
VAISILTNIPSLLAQSKLARHIKDLNQTYERLSTGLRINHAWDDAAGLAIADKLRADTRVAQQAIRNANDGLSLLSITDGSLTEISNVLTRIAELAQISANGVYTDQNRSPIQAEVAALMSEITRIARTTKFNGLDLLTGTLGTVAFQVGLTGQGNSQIVFDGVSSNLHALQLGDSNEGHLYNASTQQNALTLLAATKNAIDLVAQFRGSVGAAESRLTHAVNEMQGRRENLQIADDTIRSADIAQEAANLTRLKILQQSATAILAQANQTPSLALSLLS